MVPDILRLQPADFFQAQTIREGKKMGKKTIREVAIREKEEKVRNVTNS